MGRFGARLSDVPRLTDTLLGNIANWQPAYLDEMRGIAEGANLDFYDIVLVNARTEVVELVKREAASQTGSEEPDGCTGVAILPEATSSRSLIHAQTWDWLSPCADTSVVLKIRTADGPDIMTFTEAGGLARNGFNSAGISITANYLESEQDYRRLGIPLALIRRRVLEQHYIADAIRVVATTPKSTSNNMIVSSVEGFALDLECAPDEAFAIYPHNGLIVHANHWQSAAALSKLKDMGFATMPDSHYRDYRVREFLKPKVGAIGWEDVRAALSDTFGAPYAVCRAPMPEESNNLGATVALVMFSPAEGMMEVTALPAINTHSVTYRLEMDEAAIAQAKRAAQAGG
jgi:isopenicillin-N N-acyltransferase-like protein